MSHSRAKNNVAGSLRSACIILEAAKELVSRFMFMRTVGFVLNGKREVEEKCP